MMIIVAALYQFKKFPQYREVQKALYSAAKAHGIKGSLLLAPEGINGTIAGTREGIDQVMSYIRHELGFDNLEYKESHFDDMPFLRLKVLLKKEIVTLDVPVDPTEKVGTYVEPKDWNALIQDPDIVVIDTRNEYEVHVGTFKGALNPQTKSFSEFPKFVKEALDPTKNRKIAMMCTGGIRCEKASSYMLSQGFEEVYHLKGGILKYLETVPESESLWEGSCFVFDRRVSVGHGLKPVPTQVCYGCRRPLTDVELASAHYKKGVHCPQCYASRTQAQHEAAAQRHYQIQLAIKRGEQHLGDAASGSSDSR
jgi:UPF0176 protein